MKNYLSVKNERDGVLSILLFVNEGQAFLSEATERVLLARSWSDAERRQITRMAKGTLERQITLDALIGACASRGIDRIDPVAREILRMSTYCLYHMDSMPAHAVVNEAVELTKKRGLARLSGFVNGVLRSILRMQESEKDKEVVSRPDTETEATKEDDKGACDGRWIRQAEKYYAVPAWIVSQWCADYGREQTESMLGALYEERPLTARVNLAKISREELLERWKAQSIDCDIIKELKTGISFFPATAIDSMPGYAEGLFYVQDFGSILAGETVPLTGGERALDLCAAPGGKASAIAERLSDGAVLACDKSGDKLALIRANAQRLGLANLQTAVSDATQHNADWEDAWDAVIADVPCSGLGVIGRKPDIKLRLTPGDIDSLVPVQARILDNAIHYVKPGGYLLYATCTISRRENEAQIEQALADHPEMELTGGMRQLFPGTDPSDGFFIALLRKKDEQ